MNSKLRAIKREESCFNECIGLAQMCFNRKNIKYTRIMLEDALKSLDEIERLRKSETVVLVGTVLNSRNVNH